MSPHKDGQLEQLFLCFTWGAMLYSSRFYATLFQFLSPTSSSPLQSIRSLAFLAAPPPYFWHKLITLIVIN